MAETTEQYRTRINQLKTAIENEPYIQKMRENIAEGISKTGNRQADIEDQFQEVIDNTTGKDVIAAPELIAARNGETNLKARLDKEQQEVTAQFAQIENTKASINYVDALKLDIAKAGGGPKDLFYSTSALTAAFPNGPEGTVEEGTYLVFGSEFSDGAHQFMWSSTTSTWEDLGVYQPNALGTKAVTTSKIADESVGDLQTKHPLVRTKKSSNLFEKLEVIDGYFVSFSNGQLVANSTYTASKKKDIAPGSTITIKYHNQLAFFDVNGNFVSGVSATPAPNTLYTLTVPNNVYYYQISTLKTNLEKQQINYGSTLLPYETGSPKILEQSIEDGSIPANKLKNKSIGDDQTQFPLLRSVESTNLYDTSKAIKGKYVSAANGTIFDGASYELLQGLKIEPNSQYTIAHLNQSVFKDADGKFISGLPATLNNNGEWTFTTPENAATMDITTYSVFSDRQQLNKGSELLPFENAFPKIDENSLSFNAMSDRQHKLNGLTWNVLGDSFTQEIPGGSPKYHYHIKNATGVDVNDYGISGSTVSTVGGGGFEPMVNRYQEMVDADIITVLGGINDGARESFVLGDMNSTDISTFYGAYKTLIAGLVTKYPLKTILTITPTKQFDMDRHAADIVEAIKKISNYYSIPCLDLYSMGGFNEINEGGITKDGLHPTDFGHRWLAGKILSFIESNVPLYY